MAKPTKFAHVLYATRRFDEMIDWYCRVFEAEVVCQNPALAFLTYDDEHHRFAFANLDVLKPERSANGGKEVGVNHLAYTYARVGDLLDTYARLKRAGIEPYWPLHHGTTLSLYYTDPDGNRLELQVDCCTPEEANNLMATPEYAANPIGVMFDADDLMSCWQSGEEDASLLVQPIGPPSPVPAAHIS